MDYIYTIPREQLLNREYPTIREGIDTNINSKEGCPQPNSNLNLPEYLITNEKYGKVDKSFIYLKIHITQSYDLTGVLDNEDFEPRALLVSGDTDYYTRDPNLNIDSYYTYSTNIITGSTESKLELVRTYNSSNPYTVGFNLSPTPSISFTGVIYKNDDYIEYVINGEVNNDGQYRENTGIIYKTYNYSESYLNQTTSQIQTSKYTTFSYYGMGVKEYNSQLKALIKIDSKLGIIETPRVTSDINIDRGNVVAFEKIMRLGEISNLTSLEKYGQGFFNVIE